MQETRISHRKKKGKIRWTGRRPAALLIIAALLFSIYVPASVQATPLKEEVVYVRLHNDGSVDRVYVVNSFQLGEEQEILDYGNYAYVQNLSGNDTIKLQGGKVTVNARGDRLHYEGFLLDPQLPWDIAISYRLNGREISAPELAGKTGRLVIRIETGFNPRGNKIFFENYALQLSLTLKDSLCKHIQAEGGSLVTAGDSKQVNFVILPDKKSLSEVRVEVKDFEMPAITIAGIRLNMDFDFEENMDLSEINELTSGLVELDDGVKELLEGIFDMQEGVSELNDGSSEMTEGAWELTRGAGKLVAGMRELDGGVGEFAGGIDELYGGIGELVAGTNGLYSGMGEIVDATQALKSGALEFAEGTSAAAEGGAVLVQGFSDYFAGILAMANAQLSGSGLPELTRNNYPTVIEGLLEAALGEAVSQARLYIGEVVYAEARQEVLETIVDNIEGMTLDIFYALEEDSEMRKSIEQMVETQLSNMEDKLAAQIEIALATQMPAIIEGVNDNPQAQQLLSLLNLLAGYDQLLAGLNGYVTGVTGISAGAEDLYEGISGLNDGLFEYYGGMKEYHLGMKNFYRSSSGLVEGIGKLKEGSSELLGGVIELRKGIIEFKDGIIELEDGTGELRKGTNDLYDGVAELKEGTSELRRETATMDKELIRGIRDKLQEMMGGEKPVCSFVSNENGNISAVQFLMQTGGITLPEIKNVDPEPTPRLTFWQRFIRLFGF